MSRFFAVVFLISTIYLYNQNSNLKEQLESKERLANYYQQLWTRLGGDYDELKEKTECFTDGYTDWKDCVDDLN